MQWLITLDNGLARVARACGWVASLAFILMLFNVFFDVVARYVFSDVSIGMQELEWHLYSVVFLLGIPYALRTDGHVRVDIIYASRSDKTKGWINLVGALTMVIPLAGFIAWLGWDFMIDSYQMGEGSGDPGGLPHRWIIKGVIPLSSFFTAVTGLGMATYALRVIKGEQTYEEGTGAGGIA